MINKKVLRIFSFLIIVVMSLLLLKESLNVRNTINPNDLNLSFHYNNPKPVDASDAIKIEINKDENHQIDFIQIDRCIDNNYLSVGDSNNYFDVYDISGNIVLDCDSEKAIEVSDGYAIIEKNGLFGVMDLNNNWIINPEYKYIEAFRKHKSIISKDGRTYNIIDDNGNLIDNGYKYIHLTFLENYIVGMISSNCCQLLDYDCNLIKEFECMSIVESLSENTLIVQNDQLAYSFKTLDNETILEGEIFTFIEPVECNNSQYDELYLVGTKDHHMGLVDQNGNYIIPTNRYNYINYISDEFIVVSENQLCGAIDIWGTPILELNHKKIVPLTENAVAVKDKLNAVGVVNYRGQVIIDTSYSDILGYGDDLVTAIYCDEIYPNEEFMPEWEKKFYYIDKNSKSVKIRCDDATSVHNFENGIAIIEYDGESALIDTKGNILLGNLSN